VKPCGWLKTSAMVERSETSARVERNETSEMVVHLIDGIATIAEV